MRGPTCDAKPSRLARNTRRILRDDDVARHLGRTHLETDPETGEVIGVFNTAFDLKVAKKEKAVSVNHLQHFEGETVGQLRSIKTDMIAVGYTVGNRSAYVIVEVSAIEDCGDRCSVPLAVYKKPEPGNDSHSEIRGLPVDNSNLELRESLAQVASRKLFGAGGL